MHRLTSLALLALSLGACVDEEFAFDPEAPEAVQHSRASDYVGKTYLLDVDQAVVTEPAGVGSLLLSLLSTVDEKPAVSVVRIDPARRAIQMRLGTVAEDGSGRWVQDECGTTTDSLGRGNTSAAPEVVTRFPSGTLAVAGERARIEGARVSGRLTLSPSALRDAGLDVRLDTSSLVPLIGGTAPDEFCVLLTALTGTSLCQECSPDDAVPEPWCVDVQLDDMPGDEIPLLTLQEITPADVAANPLCP